MSTVALKAGIIAVSVVVAAGIAIYESPELRRMAEELRRRIAVALYSLGDSISPQERENLFNRPEDAEGFLRSRGIDVREDLGVDADDETRRRQREELMYWNAIAESKRDQVKDTEKARPRAGTRGSSFDDFLKQDEFGEKGSFVFNSGAEVHEHEATGLRHRGETPRSINHSVYTNPFADEHGIDEHIILENSLMDPEKDEIEDIYSVSDAGKREASKSTTATLSAPPDDVPTLVDIGIPPNREENEPILPAASFEPHLGADEFVTAGQDDRHDAYSSIQAWARTTNPSFYSPLPVSPAGPLSEPELVSDGALTPTDTASLAGSGEDVADEARSVSSMADGRYYDVVSDDDGMATPASWTEVGSVISESDAAAVQQPAHA